MAFMMLQESGSLKRAISKNVSKKGGYWVMFSSQVALL